MTQPPMISRRDMPLAGLAISLGLLVALLVGGWGLGPTPQGHSGVSVVWGGPPATQRPPAVASSGIGSGLSVGCVDFDELQERCSKSAKYETIFRDLDRDLEDVNRKIRLLETEIDNLKKEARATAPIFEKQWDIQRKMADVMARRQAERELAELKMLWHEQEVQRLIRDDVTAAVKTAATARGVGLVLARSMVTFLPGASGKAPQPRRQAIVLYAEARHDLTEAARAALDAQNPPPNTGLPPARPADK